MKNNGNQIFTIKNFFASFVNIFSKSRDLPEPNFKVGTGTGIGTGKFFERFRNPAINAIIQPIRDFEVRVILPLSKIFDHPSSSSSLNPMMIHFAIDSIRLDIIPNLIYGGDFIK